MNLSSRLNCSTIKKKNEISDIIRDGKKIRTEIGSVFFYSKNDSLDNKVAILLKKNIGKAHFRNYIIRIIRFYVRSESTLFERFNRVIFLYNSQNKAIEYKRLKNIYNKALNSV